MWRGGRAARERLCFLLFVLVDFLLFPATMYDKQCINIQSFSVSASLCVSKAKPSSLV